MDHEYDWPEGDDDITELIMAVVFWAALITLFVFLLAKVA